MVRDLNLFNKLSKSFIIITFLFHTKTIDSMVDIEIEDQFNCGVNDSEAVEEAKLLVRQSSMAFLEIAIFYDQSFHKKFSYNLHDFLRTLFRQVQIIYEYPTLTQVSIGFVVTKIEEVNSNEVPFNWHIFSYKNSLCLWQLNKYPPKNRNFDSAIFLTAGNLFDKATDSNSIGGVATTWGACGVSGQNCALVTVQGFSHSWSIAHEIGHQLGARHDTKERFCDQLGLMNASGNPHIWSNCSNKYFNDFLSHQNSSCLWNQPSKPIWDLINDRSIPADSYDAHKQCSVYFGQNYRHFYDLRIPVFADPCKKLMCGYDMIDISAKQALEGTSCPINNRNGKCRVGQCVL